MSKPTFSDTNIKVERFIKYSIYYCDIKYYVAEDSGFVCERPH